MFMYFPCVFAISRGIPIFQKHPFFKDSPKTSPINKYPKTTLPSGKHTKNAGKSPFLMGKSTINSHFQVRKV